MLNSIHLNESKYDAEYILNALDKADGSVDGKISNVSIWNNFANILNEESFVPENNENMVSKLNDYIKNAASEIISAIEAFIDSLNNADKEPLLNDVEEQPETFEPFELDLTNKQEKEVELVNEYYEKNKKTYEYVSEKTGIPAKLICAIHYRECTCRMTRKIKDGKSSISPNSWASNAIAILNKQKNSFFKYCETNNIEYPGEHFSSMQEQTDFAEFWNGLGYKRKNRVSPYVYAGTTKYKSGMYVRDGRYSPTAVDPRIGVAVALLVLDNVVNVWGTDTEQIVDMKEPNDNNASEETGVETDKKDGLIDT